MTNSEKEHLSGLIQHTNKTQSAYLACICGMWSNTYGVLLKSSPFTNPGLNSWWLSGWLGSDNAHNITQNIRKKQEESEKNWFENLFAKKMKKQ